ncbi:MAG: polysulfide reductase NrfD [Chloroflexi bacterium]|mgnify:CR=1 FL=1|jgi:molybdopterin-containing oxidoreductase family membrane subunit|nr:polysulfide reductase NrfD [Chloroflexota bacterium]
MADTTVTVQETRRQPFVWRATDLFWVAGAILMLIGAWGMWQRLTGGLGPTALGSYVPWGLWVGFYDYLVWLEVGSLLVFTTLLYLVGARAMTPMKPLVLFTGFIVLVMALLVVFLDLGQAFRFWRVLVNPEFSSMIAVMVWLHLLYLLVLLAELALVMGVGSFGENTRERWLKILAFVSLPMGLALILVSGSVFGVVAARPLWNTSALPVMFLVSAIAAGSALLLLLTVLFWPNKEEAAYQENVARLARLTGWLLLAGVFAAGIIGLTSLYQGGNPMRTEAIMLILTGPFWWSFWLVHVLLGVFVPVLLLFQRGEQPRWAGIAALLSVVTFVAVTLNVVIPTLATPELEGLAGAFVHDKLNFNYVPNLVEWLVILFVVGLGGMLYGLGLRFLPVLRSAKEEA